MSRVAPFPDLDAARAGAARWVAKLDRGLNESEQIDLALWLDSPANQRAFEEMGGLWASLEVMSVLSDVFPQDDPAPVAQVAPVAQTAPVADVTVEPVPPPAAAPRTARRWLLGGALAASLVVALTLAWWSQPALRGMIRPAALAGEARPDVHRTQVGERRTVTLSDGSMLTLNTASEVAVHIDGQQRRLTLRRGEAHFEVAHDTTRPFIVTAGDHAVRAVGTAFNIRLREGLETDVLVTSGTVRVAPSVAGTGAVSTVTAGQLLQLRQDGTSQLQALDAAALDAQLGWRRGVLIFDGATLSTVVAEISRYTPRRIRLADAGLGQRRIVGFFPTDDLQGLLQALESNVGLVVTESGNDILLAARPPSG